MQYLLLFLALAINSDPFQILWDLYVVGTRLWRNGRKAVEEFVCYSVIIRKNNTNITECSWFYLLSAKSA